MNRLVAPSLLLAAPNTCWLCCVVCVAFARCVQWVVLFVMVVAHVIFYVVCGRVADD